MNVFAKLSDVRKLIDPVFPNEQMELLCLAAKWHYNKHKPLSPDAAKLYELLIRNSYNPDTVYKWFLLAKSPLQLREQLQRKMISQREAFFAKKQLNSIANTSHQQLLHDIMDSIERYIVR